MSVNQHDIEWDQETISAFWNRYSSDSAIIDQYFSRQKGAAVLRLTKKQIDVSGRVVDLGCGPGYFIEHLLMSGISCEGADISSTSVQELNKRLGDRKLFLGAQVSAGIKNVPFANNSVDVCFFLETIEHLLPDDRDQYLMNIINALAPGGRLVVTVPYAEDLENAKVTCPACGCRFHRVQHLSAFTPKSLRTIMEERGFETIFCRPVILLPDWNIYLSALKMEIQSRKTMLHYCPECGHGFAGEKSFWRRLLGKLKIAKVFHLVYIGRRPQT